MQPVFWIILGGHFRSFDRNIYNVQSMANLSSSCSFVCLYVRKYLAEKSIGYNQKIQHPIKGFVQNKLNAVANIFDNYAYAITDSSEVIPRTWAHLDSWFAGPYFIQAIRHHYAMGTHPHDMILFSRPDVTYSHAINVHDIHQPAAIYLSHSAKNPARGNDPTELFFLVSREVWRRVMDLCIVTISKKRIQFCHNIRNCVNKSLDIMAEAPEMVGANLAYGPSKFGITIVRMNNNRARITLNGMPARSIVTHRLDFNQDLLRFHSRCSRTPMFHYRKAMLHHYVADKRSGWS